MAPWADTQEDADPSDAQRTSSELRKDAEADQTDVGNVEFLGRHQIRIQYVFEVANLEKKIIRFGLGLLLFFFLFAMIVFQKFLQVPIDIVSSGNAKTPREAFPTPRCEAAKGEG